MKHVKQAVVIVAMIVALALMGEAQISVPHTFSTSVPVSQLNTNFSTVADGALKRNGGNVSGNITVDTGITIDGVDISAALGGSSTGAFSSLTTSSTGATSIDAAGGITAGTGNVGIVGTDGRIPALSTTYFASLSAANMTVDGSTQLDDYIYSATTYTPTWTTTGTPPSIGNGTLYGEYVKVGRLIVLTIQLTWGSTTTGGTGQWYISLPTTSATGMYGMIGNGIGYDASAAGTPYMLSGIVVGASTATALFLNAAAVTATAPLTWATGDVMHYTIMYRSAS